MMKELIPQTHKIKFILQLFHLQLVNIKLIWYVTKHDTELTRSLPRNYSEYFLFHLNFLDFLQTDGNNDLMEYTIKIFFSLRNNRFLTVLDNF